MKILIKGKKNNNQNQSPVKKQNYKTDLIIRNRTQYLLAVMSFVTDPCTFCATTKRF